MAYLAKSTVLQAYQLLSNIDTDKRQGLTQKVSALKYASALDRYYLIHHQNCNLKQSANKDLFASYIGEIVKINNEQCTKDFFLGVSANGRDFDCGSNFFSQSSVKDSKTNPYETFLYPKRSGWQPVMDVKDQELIFRSDYLPDVFSFYLGTPELRLAFIIWLLRFTEIGEENLDGLRLSLINTFSINFCNALYIDAVNYVDTSYIEFDNEMCQLSQKDILSLFNSSKKHSCESPLSANAPLQQIYYGAPGTGKSHATNEVTSKYPDTVRTTFHPDSDYSTFVGAYKPTMMKVRKAVVIGQDEKEVKPLDGNSEWEEKIAYKFVKQAFLKAYVKAWKKFAETCVEGRELAPQFLVIEEINRGNCAQIFGDLFQLLDRKDNFSEYPIEADADICKALLEEDTKDNPSFGASGLQLTDEQKTYINNVYNDKPVAEKICSGEVLALPPNLYIWATMNTSDQSLFPIDSAFKRRWEWKYMKIKQGYKKDEQGNILLDAEGKKVPLGWKIEIKGEDEQVKLTQDWWAFIQKINAIIASMTSSADKQLGYFFCKADNDGVISGNTFVSKVIFYLWNDVFKDYGFEDASLFRYKVKEGEKEVEKDLTFPDFHDEDGEKVNAERLVDFIQKVMDWQKPEENV